MLEEKYNYIIPNYNSERGIGSPRFGEAKEWCHKFLKPMKKVKEMVVLDYGCGDGRLANFMAAVFEKWIYYGLEHPKSALRQLAEKSPFFNDERCIYGLMGSDIEKEALEKAKSVVLGSVFTHLKFDDFEGIMEQFKPILDRKGEVIFSVFIDNEYHWETHTGVYGVPNCIARVYYTEDQLKEYAKKNEYNLTEHEPFLAQKENLHRIFKITAKQKRKIRKARKK